MRTCDVCQKQGRSDAIATFEAVIEERDVKGALVIESIELCADCWETFSERFTILVSGLIRDLCKKPD